MVTVYTTNNNSYAIVETENCTRFMFGGVIGDTPRRVVDFTIEETPQHDEYIKAELEYGVHNTKPFESSEIQYEQRARSIEVQTAHSTYLIDTENLTITDITKNKKARGPLDNALEPGETYLIESLYLTPDGFLKVDYADHMSNMTQKQLFTSAVKSVKVVKEMLLMHEDLGEKRPDPSVSLTPPIYNIVTEHDSLVSAEQDMDIWSRPAPNPGPIMPPIIYEPAVPDPMPNIEFMETIASMMIKDKHYIDLAQLYENTQTHSFKDVVKRLVPAAEKPGEILQVFKEQGIDLYAEEREKLDRLPETLNRYNLTCEAHSDSPGDVWIAPKNQYQDVEYMIAINLDDVQAQTEHSIIPQNTSFYYKTPNEENYNEIDLGDPEYKNSGQYKALKESHDKIINVLEHITDMITMEKRNEHAMDMGVEH